jgi:hypothetical protein
MQLYQRIYKIYEQIFYICISVMKIFACILSFYIVVLTAIPCVDKPEDHTLQKTEISQKTTDSQQQDIDHCSPFCTCNCCSSSKIQQYQVIAFNNFPILTERVYELSSNYVSSHTAAIWQPPRLN